MQYLHRKKILHRDLKTENIFVNLDRDNEVTHLTIGDFDVASISDEAKTVVGTLGFIVGWCGTFGGLGTDLALYW